MSRIISFIGARVTPEKPLAKIAQIAEFFAKKGWIMRSGGANGVDFAAEEAFSKYSNKKEIYLPWKSFNENPSQLLWTQANFQEVSKHHPNWDGLKLSVKSLHSRNASILLGLDNETPSDLCVAWTNKGAIKGGTGLGIRISLAHNIPLYNLGAEDGLDKLREFCKTI